MVFATFAIWPERGDPEHGSYSCHGRLRRGTMKTLKDGWGLLLELCQQGCFAVAVTPTSVLQRDLLFWERAPAGFV